MTSYLVRRFLYAILTFLGITVATFTLIHSVPGDPIAFYIGRGGIKTIPPETIARIRAEFHLDKPLPEQYLYWLRGIVTFDFGHSVIDRRPVRTVVVEKLPATFQLNLIAFLIAATLGVPIGLWSASRSGRLTERASAVGFFLLYSLPSFWVALMLIQLFSVRFHVLPLFGMVSDQYDSMSAGARFMDRLQHLVLPTITLTYAQLAIFARFSKSAVTEVIRQDFITAARAKGAGNVAVMWRHAFRNALIPMITLLGLTIPYLISGSVIVEKIFQWDGIGLLYYDAILARDYPVVMALTVVTAVITLLASMLADVLYAFADPRVRLGEGER
ncbi:MAG TPA: ABC transporter permease [Thermoanaerobaculia bacterium]|jgi:peptide/nickel transport system permease protein|nr:ABC transporter permease [Thermoanaerobaculia bacterium]